MVSRTRKKSVEGQSKALKPIKGSWKSMYIGWGCADPDAYENGAPLVLPLPFINFSTENEFTASHALTDYNVEKTEKPEKRKLNVEYERSWFERVLKEKNFAKLEKERLVQLAIANDQASEEISESHKDPVGIVVSEISQWVCIRVDREASDLPAKIQLWGFLQPRGFNGETPMSLSAYNPFSGSAVQSDEEDHLSTSISDRQRSGWGEYEIDCEKRTAKRWSYLPDGSQKVEEVPPGDVVFYHRWRFDEMEINGKKERVKDEFLGDVVKIKIAIRNELTAGDRKAIKEQKAQRVKAFKEANPNAEFREEDVPQSPENVVEVGCWLKVWARNARIEWDGEPKDDRTDWIVQSMDSVDVGVGIEVTQNGNLDVKSPFPWRNHGFLRGRIVDGRNVKAKKIPKPSELVPLYAALVTPEGSKHLNDLCEYFKAPKEPDKAALKMLASGAVGFLGNSLIALIVFYSVKDYLKKMNLEVPDSTTTQAIFEEEKKEKIKARIKFIQALLRFFDAPNKLAAFGVSGFRATTMDGLKAEAKNRPGLFNLYSTIFATQLDMALCLHPELLNDLVNDSLQARSEALTSFLGNQGASQTAATRLGPIDALAKNLKELQLKSDFKWGQIDIDLNLVGYSKTEYFPKPFGLLLAPFGVPVGFLSLKVSRSAGLDFNFQVLWGDTSFGMGFGLTLADNSGLKVGVELCALWAILARPDYIPPAPGNTGQRIRPGHNRATAAQEVNRIENRSQSGQTASSQEVQETLLLKLIQNLQGAMNASVSVDLGLSAAGHIGWRFQYDRVKHETSFKLEALESKDPTETRDLKLTLDAGVTIEIKLGFLTWSWKIASIELARLTPEEFTVPLKARLVNKEVDFGPAYTYKLVENVGNIIYLAGGTEDNDFYRVAGPAGPEGIFGRVASAALKPRLNHQNLCFGESKKIYLQFGSKEMPKIGFNLKHSDGLAEPPSSLPNFNPDPFVSEAKAEFVFGTKADGKPSKTLEYTFKISSEKLGTDYLAASFELQQTPKESSFQSRCFAHSVASNEYVPVMPEAFLLSKARQLKKDLLLFRRPRLLEVEAGFGYIEGFGRALSAKVKIQNFDEAGIWVRLQLRPRGFNGPFVKTGTQFWSFLKFYEPTLIDHVSGGELRIKMADYPIRVGDQFSFDLAFFPDDGCILKKADFERPIFTA